MAYRKTQRIEAQLADKRVRILAAARELVSRRGFRGAGIDAVAASAGIATGTVYRYFPSKAALLVEVVSRVSEREVEAVAAVAEAGGDGTAMLGAAVACFARRALANRRLAYAMIVEPSDPEVEAVRLIYRRLLADVFRRAIAAGIASGEFAAQDAGIAATCIVGALLEALIGPLAESERDAGRTVAEIARFCMAAVARAPDETRNRSEIMN